MACSTTQPVAALDRALPSHYCSSPITKMSVVHKIEKQSSKLKSLPPGFHFQPSEEELVGYFLSAQLLEIASLGVKFPVVDVAGKGPSDLTGEETLSIDLCFKKQFPFFPSLIFYYYYLQAYLVRICQKTFTFFQKCRLLGKLRRVVGGKCAVLLSVRRMALSLTSLPLRQVMFLKAKDPKGNG